jgi:D-tyrosyl-tRNA(Tyr) deacylase
MKAVIQRVRSASVSIDGVVVSRIQTGLLILLGVHVEDRQEDLDWLVSKVAKLRIFPDEEGVMNCSVIEAGGEVIVVSQFTLYASTKKGNRPSYILAARPELAIPMYEKFVAKLKQEAGVGVFTGKFGADMQVSLVNDGPVTIIVDSKNNDPLDK